MKNWLKITMTTVVALGLSSATLLAQTTLKWAHVYETSEPYHTWSVWAGEQIEKQTNGKYKVEVYPASSLGKETDINQGMQLGTVDMIISGLSFAARSVPRIGVGYYPFTFRDGNHLLAWSKSDGFAELAGMYEKKTGIHITAMTYYGARHTTSNRQFSDCAGMKNLKIRVPDVPAYMAMPKACGANPTPIAFSEVYLALQSGTVEAQENPLPTIDAKKFYEVQKHIMLTGHIVDAVATQVAPHIWNNLSAVEKTLFTNITREAAQKASQEIMDREAKLAAVFRERGLTVTDVDRDSFQKAVLKAVPIASMGYDKSDWDKIQAIR